MSNFEQCLKRTFSKFSVARKPIINGGAIRPGGLLFLNKEIFFQNMCPLPKITTSNHTKLLFLAEKSANISFEGDI